MGGSDSSSNDKNECQDHDLDWEEQSSSANFSLHSEDEVDINDSPDGSLNLPALELHNELLMRKNIAVKSELLDKVTKYAEFVCCLQQVC